MCFGGMLTFIDALDVATGVAPLIGNWMGVIVNDLSSELPCQIRYPRNKRYPTSSPGCPGPSTIRPMNAIIREGNSHEPPEDLWQRSQRVALSRTGIPMATMRKL